MNNCGTCKYFGVPDQDKWSNDGLRQCAAIQRRSVVSDYDEDYNIKLHKGIKAVAVDGSDYIAALRVAEDFGCVMWEPKP